MNHSIKKAYFRPWSPNCQDQGQSVSINNNNKLEIGTSKTAFQPYRRQSQRPMRSSSHDISYSEQQSNNTKYNVPRLGHQHQDIDQRPLHSPDNSLLEQLQTTHYSYEGVETSSTQQNVQTRMDMQMRTAMQTNSEQVRDNRTCVIGDLRLSQGNIALDDHAISDSRSRLKCHQNRNIINVPRPMVHIGHRVSAFRRIRQPNHYPLPSPKDGEPLDLLPKSLYTNKAHGGHVCIFCGKMYSRKYGLKIHLRTHTGFKPLHCKICQRPFGDPSNLNKHIRLHAHGETPYRCGKCGKVLVRRRDLERHVRSRHPLDVDMLSSIDPMNSPVSSEDGTSCCYSNSSFEVETTEELDVVG